jgi:hypothetical protein
VWGEKAEYIKLRLMSIYQINQNPSKELCEDLSKELNIPSRSIRDYFGRKKSSKSRRLSSSICGNKEESIRFRLHAEYQIDPNPSKEYKENLSKELNIPLTSISEWFSRKRDVIAFNLKNPIDLRLSKICESYPSKEKRLELAEELDIPLSVITRWFNNRRYNVRRRMKNKV